MLSKQADQFMIELRMYLMSKGKNDKEINEVIDELSDHILQAEAEGKSIKDITGESPRAYMKSIGQEMGFDARQLISLIPFTSLLVMAYFCFAPAILGEFSLSKMGIWGAIVGTILSLVLYGFLFVRVLPKVFYSKWFYIIVGIAYLLLSGFFVLVYLFDNDPFFVATPLQNNLILIGCMAVFIIFSLYAKSWISIIIPLFMSLGPLTARFIPKEMNEDPFYITLTVIFCILVTIVILYFVFRKGKKKSSTY